MYEYIEILLGAHPILHISRIRVNKSVQFLFVTCSVDSQVAVTETAQNKNTSNKGQ
jgi:hypothetical protein